VSFSLLATLLYIWIGMGVATFFLLLKVTAPFGRYSSVKWGPLIDNRLGWFIMETTVLFTFWYQAWPVLQQDSTPVLIMAGLFTLHYVNRAVIFPLRLRTKGKKMPVVIMFSAIFFNLVNGSSLGYYFAHFAAYSADWVNSVPFIAGLIFFCAGMILNWTADDHLIHLRKQTETGYRIPYGKLFEYVSCPNHFGEIIEWFGYALLCWNLPALAFFIWTSANLIPRAISHHRWYRQHFPDYPTERKAVIPFIV
jgi:hypothetical protein